jgi:S-adenosyl-L-methionine hydrolase (adenosine-forming)
MVSMAGPMRTIALTTDFGDSHYVGEMRGVIKKVNQAAEILDVTHSVEPHNVVGGAFILSRVFRHFPKNTVHVAVVDPGVGGGRKALAIETDYCFMLGPDNGILRWALRDQQVVRAVALDPVRVQKLAGLSEVSATFHGRDVFAPAAALLTKGVDLSMMGERVQDIAALELMEDAVVHVDRFGNIITTVAREIEPGTKVTVVHNELRYEAVFVRTFGDAQPGELIVLSGSHGLLEVDVNQGSAAQRLGAKAGDRLSIVWG